MRTVTVSELAVLVKYLDSCTFELMRNSFDNLYFVCFRAPDLHLLVCNLNGNVKCWRSSDRALAFVQSWQVPYVASLK